MTLKELSLCGSSFCILRKIRNKWNKKVFCENATTKREYLLLFIDKLLEGLFTFVQNDDRIKNR